MSMIRWEPFRDFMTLRQAMDRLFEESVGRPTTAPFAAVYTPCDVWETPNELFVRLAVAGARPEDVSITVTGDTLTISGKIQSPAESEEAKSWTWHLAEMRSGDFSRTFTLPTSVSSEQAEAQFEHGVLTLRLPKTPEVRPRQIPIRAGTTPKGEARH